MCLLALRRAQSAAKRYGNKSDVLLHAFHAVGAAERWRKLYDAASVRSQTLHCFRGGSCKVEEILCHYGVAIGGCTGPAPTGW